MIWGYHYFWKHPHTSIWLVFCHNLYIDLNPWQSRKYKKVNWVPWHLAWSLVTITGSPIDSINFTPSPEQKTPSISWKASHFLSKYRGGFKWHQFDKKKPNCQSDCASTKHDVSILTLRQQKHIIHHQHSRFWWDSSTSMPSIFKEAKLLRLQVNSKPFFLRGRNRHVAAIASAASSGGNFCFIGAVHWYLVQPSFQIKVYQPSVCPVVGSNHQILELEALMKRMNGGSDFSPPWF